MKTKPKRTAYTDGPWTVQKEKLGKLPPLHVMAGDLFIGSFHETHERGEEAANAQICSAAPDLYEAVRVGLTGADSKGQTYTQEQAIQKLQNALAKAEGRL